MIWLYSVVGLFAGIGVIASAYWAFGVWKGFRDTVKELIGTLKDAAEIARAYREDLSVLRQIAQSAPAQHLEEEPESIIPGTEQYGSRMPEPYFGRYPIRVEEPEAPLTSAQEVDMTPTEEDLIEQEREEAVINIEAQERQKAASREADAERLKGLAGLGISPEEK